MTDVLTSHFRGFLQTVHTNEGMLKDSLKYPSISIRPNAIHEPQIGMLSAPLQPPSRKPMGTQGGSVWMQAASLERDNVPSEFRNNNIEQRCLLFLQTHCL
jgi:hypothetical protein